MIITIAEAKEEGQDTTEVSTGPPDNAHLPCALFLGATNCTLSYSHYVHWQTRAEL